MRNTPVDRTLLNLYRNLKPGDMVTTKTRQPSYRNSEQSNCNVPNVFLEPGEIAEVISTKVPCVRNSSTSYMNEFVHVSFQKPNNSSDTSRHSAGIDYKDIILVKKA